MKLSEFFLVFLFSVVLACPIVKARHADIEMSFDSPSSASASESKMIKSHEKFKQQKKLIVELFSCVDEYEFHFREMKYLNVLGKLPELKIKFSRAQNIYRRYEARMNEQLKIMGSLYFSRYQLFTGLGEVLKNLRLDSGFRAALMRSGTVVLNNYSELLEYLKTSPVLKTQELNDLKLKIANVSRRNQKYKITSKYFELDDNKIPAGEQLMVLEIKGNRALVLYMGPTMTNSQIEGWVNLRDLEKRTSWVNSNKDFY